jgi:hypothetical protein
VTFQNIWQQLCRKRPKLNDPQSVAEFTSDNLKSLLEQVYDQGFKQGKESVSSADDAKTTGFDSLFGNIFGGKKL